MIHVCLERCPEGAEAALAELALYQQAVDAAGTYAERVKAADAHWRSRRGNKPLDVVRDMLSAMCPGIRRCMFCEDSARIDLDHFRPKSLYPELVFAWVNYLYVCKQCNTDKGARFKL